MEFEIVFCTSVTGRLSSQRPFFMVNEQCGGPLQSDQRKYKMLKSSPLCVAVFFHPCLPQTPREGDVILRRSTHWPARRLERTQPRIIDSGAALKCWLSTTCRIAPPDCWLCMRRRRLLTCGRIFWGNSLRFSYSIITHQNSRPPLLRCSCKRWWGLGRGGELLIKTSFPFNIFLVNCCMRNAASPQLHGCYLRFVQAVLNRDSASQGD